MFKMLDELWQAFRWIYSQLSRFAAFLSEVFGFSAEGHGETPAASVQTLDAEASLEVVGQPLRQEVVDKTEGALDTGQVMTLPPDKTYAYADNSSESGSIYEEAMSELSQSPQREVKDGTDGGLTRPAVHAIGKGTSLDTGQGLTQREAKSATTLALQRTIELWNKLPGTQLIGQAVSQLACLGETSGSGIVAPPLRINNKTPAASTKMNRRIWSQIHEKFKLEIRNEIENLERPEVALVTGRGCYNDSQETRLETNSAAQPGGTCNSQQQRGYRWKKKELIRPLNREQIRKLYLDPDSAEFSDVDRERHFTDQLKILYADQAIASLSDLERTELKASGTTLSTAMKRKIDDHLVQLKFISFAEEAVEGQSTSDTLAAHQKPILKASKVELEIGRATWARNPERPVDITCLCDANMAKGTIQELLASKLASELGGAKLPPVIHCDKFQKTTQSVWPPTDRAMGHFASKYIGHPNTLLVRPLSVFAPLRRFCCLMWPPSKKSLSSIAGAASEFARQLFLGNFDLHHENIIVEDVIDIDGKITNSAKVIDYGLAFSHKHDGAEDAIQSMATIMLLTGLGNLPMDIDLFKRTIHDVLRSFSINGDGKCGLNVARINDCLAIGIERFRQAVECRWLEEEWKDIYQEIRLEYQPVDVEGFWAAVTASEPGQASGPAGITGTMVEYVKAHSRIKSCRQISNANVAATSWAKKCTHYIKIRSEVDDTFAECVKRAEEKTSYEKRSAELVGGKYTLTMEHFMDLLLSEMNLWQAAKIAEQYSWIGIVAMTKANIECTLRNFHTMKVEMAPLLDIIGPDDRVMEKGKDKVSRDWAKISTSTYKHMIKEAKRIHDALEKDCFPFWEYQYDHSILDEICNTEDLMAREREQKQASRAEIMEQKLSEHRLLWLSRLEQGREKLGTPSSTTLSGAHLGSISKEREVSKV